MTEDDNTPWWRRWFGRPDYSSWSTEQQRAAEAAHTPRTERELLERIASDLATIRMVVVWAFWISVVAGIALAYANSGNG
jgi:hypothetical protein